MSESKSEYVRIRMEEARSKQPDWEKLWEEQSNRADALEAQLEERETCITGCLNDIIALKALLAECETVLQDAIRYEALSGIRAFLAKLIKKAPLSGA